MERIKRLRDEALKNTICYDEFFYHFYKYHLSDGRSLAKDGYADAFYYAFSNITPSISEDELVVGKCNLKLSGKMAEEYNSTYFPAAKKQAMSAGGGQDSHMAIDYELVLSEGLNGIIKKIDSYMSDSDDSEKLEFYKTCRRCLEAVIKYSENYSDYAKKLATETEDEKRKSELETISEICRKVPANPAESFYEALQSVHFITLCLSMNPFRVNTQQFQLGRPDRYLLPYYLNDIEKGLLTKNEAQILLDALGIQINNRVSSGLSSGYMVGGRDKNGNILENELTLMCMKVVDDIRLVYPAVGLCHTAGMDDEFLKEALRILSEGCSHPAIFNDDLIRKGLEGYGVPDTESHNYIHSTCVEITPIASSNVWVASPYTNMPQILLDIMDREYESFDELKTVYFKKLDESIKRNFEEQNAFRKTRFENSRNPLLSCFVNDCLLNGCDIEKGGAKYNFIMPSFVGVANLVDSLYAIREVVFDKKELGLKELKAILDKNFEGEELLCNRLLNAIPKYGNDFDDVDSFFGEITEHIIAECKKYKGMHNGGDVIPSVFCWIMHEQFGRVTGATPDGRLSGFPLGDGSGPCQGREMNGPTASILSSTKWKHKELIGGVAVNMKFSKKSLGAESLNTMKALVKTYLERGGFEMQINVLDKETLEKAMLSPVEYRDLVVRIGGYSDYFVRLSKDMQQEVILRTEHVI